MWDCSPRQATALLEIAQRRRKRELRDKGAMMALAFRGDPKALQQALRDDSDPS